jgi:hypothetical protein
MQDGLLSRIIDRVVGNARAIRGAPEAIAVAGVIAVGMSHKPSGSPDDRRSGGRDSLLDFARQPFTMSNHLVEILFHSRRGSICLEPPGLRRCCAIVRGRLRFR